MLQPKKATGCSSFEQWGIQKKISANSCRSSLIRSSILLLRPPNFGHSTTLSSLLLQDTIWRATTSSQVISNLVSGKVGICFSWDRVSLAEILLRTQALSNWYREFFKKDLRHYDFEIGETVRSGGIRHCLSRVDPKAEFEACFDRCPSGTYSPDSTSMAGPGPARHRTRSLSCTRFGKIRSQ